MIKTPKRKWMIIVACTLFIILPFLYAGSGVVRPFITRFTSLVDTPSSYSSQASKIVAVNVGASAVEFVTESVFEDGGASEIAVTAGMMNTGTNASATTYWRGDNTWVTPSGSGDLLADGSVPLTANWDVGAYSITALRFVSDQATGTAPFTVASTTEVANLKAATATTATVATTVTITDNESTAENNPLVFVAGGDLDGGNLGLESDGTTYYTPSTGIITATGFAGALTGNVTGNASGTAGVATTVTITDNESTAENNPIVFVAGGDLDGGDLGLESDGTAYYTPSTGKITATGFVGALTGNADTVTTNANLTGDVTSTGNATDINQSVLEDGGTDELAITAGMMNTGTNASASTYWRGDNTWVTPTGSGDMTKAVYDVSDDGFVDGNDVAYASTWNGNVNAPSMNVIYDYLHNFDADDDGSFADETWLTGAYQPLAATLTSIAGLTETNGGIPYGTADNAYAWLAAGAEGTLLMGNGAGAPSWLGAGTSGYILVAAGAADPVWTAPTGTGSPVKATSPTLVTPALGTPSALVGTNITGTGASYTAGTATLASTVTVADESSDTTSFLLFTTAATGSLAAKTGAGLTIDASTDTLGATIVKTPNNIKDEPKHMIFTIIDPLTTQTEDNEICLWPVTPAALTITKIVVTLDAAANEVAGDLKYADAFIGLANPVVINTFDTTSGVLADDSITSGTVASGKCIYLSFDSAPNTAIHQMSVDITWDYD